ncbi:MerR family transcriptional regulator [Spirosoma pollinicola]|uniref:Heavy metal-responsive transcriptional regulator n=1 Tax=Spirosoma pollinicola TaxID=2057025 RepID=A0A2K8Z2M0_9BACT|nr:MerR family transcriptional regulator [Spirosoma pollinicola]AUD04117.1 heavy metal-responsive transcriptional regulator [Spirosoma pollinicola]
MLIGIIAQESGFSRDTIRYYEKIGLLRLPKRARRENNYKEYSPAILSRLRAIKELKNIGYTLREIQQVITSYETGGLDCIAGKDQVLEKVRLIDAQMAQLQRIKQQLLEAVAECPDQCKITAILDGTLASPK